MTKHCYVCFADPFIEPIESTCDTHSLCHFCIFEFFKSAEDSEFYYPPVCCRPLDNKLLKLFDDTFVNKYLVKEEEYKTPRQLRTYCSGCGIFLHTPSNGEFEEIHGTCSKCNVSTCKVCKLEVDISVKHRCQGLQEDEGIKVYGSKNGFKHCPRCNILIGLSGLCNHVKCLWCGYQFCFVCLQPPDARYGIGKPHDCPEYLQPMYDKDGFDWRGLHRDTGLDREGYNRHGLNDAGLGRYGDDDMSEEESSTHSDIASATSFKDDLKDSDKWDFGAGFLSDVDEAARLGKDEIEVARMMRAIIHLTNCSDDCKYGCGEDDGGEGNNGEDDDEEAIDGEDNNDEYDDGGNDDGEDSGSNGDQADGIEG